MVLVTIRRVNIYLQRSYRCLGGKAEDFPSLAAARKVGVDYTLAAANAFVKGICPALPQGQKFQFVFCSGKGAEWDQDKSLWVFPDTRKLKVIMLHSISVEGDHITDENKGAVERGLLDIAEANPDVFAATMLRPGGVIPDENGLLGTIAGLMIPVVKVSKLAKALIRACVEPSNEKVIQNEEISQIGA